MARRLNVLVNDPDDTLDSKDVRSIVNVMLENDPLDPDELTPEEFQGYIDSLPARSNLRRYSREEIMKYLANREPAQPEEPGEPHQIVRD